jgi:hypothetical protein
MGRLNGDGPLKRIQDETSIVSASRHRAVSSHNIVYTCQADSRILAFGGNRLKILWFFDSRFFGSPREINELGDSLLAGPDTCRGTRGAATRGPSRASVFGVACAQRKRRRTEAGARRTLLRATARHPLPRPPNQNIENNPMQRYKPSPAWML